MLQKKLYPIIIAVAVVIGIGYKFYSMKNDIRDLETTVAVKTVQVDNANSNTERANKTVKTLVAINEDIVDEVRLRQEQVTLEHRRVVESNAIIREAETAALRRQVYLEKAKTRMSAIAKRKPKLLEKIINKGNARMFAEIESLTNLGV